jgi:arginyl-tRNA synthetase
VPPEAIRVAAPAERALAIALLKFPTALAGVASDLEPHVLCTYLYDLATSFSTFYEACPVLKAPTTEERLSRLALCDLTAKVIARGLELLGIEAPERM